MAKDKAKRKYFTEFNLNVYSSEPVIVAPADLDKIQHSDEEAKERIKHSNIYLILKRPRISFVPNTIKVNDREVSGRISVQTESGVNEFNFNLPGALPEYAKSAKASNYPHTKLILFSEENEDIYTMPMAYLLRHMKVDLQGLDYLEVAYVGQAFGSSGERTAVERLASHSTLQKILADITANQPHIEVLLALYQFEYHRFFITMDGINGAQITGDADKEHYQNSLHANFKRSMRISLAEAALIRYFQPEYNKIYKKEFPAKRHKVLRKLYDFDFAAITVEASVEDHGMRLFSGVVKPSWHHIAKFDLHDTNERKSFFFSAP